MRNRQWSLDSLIALFYRCVETYNYFSEPKFYLKTKMFTIWFYGLFSYFGMVYCIGKKKSLIKSSISNVTPDFIFHLWFYCFSPCPLSLTHLLHVFNPHLKLSTVSLLFCKSSSEVSVPTQHPLKIVHVECTPSCYLLSALGSPYCPYRASGCAAGLIRNFTKAFLHSHECSSGVIRS